MAGFCIIPVIAGAMLAQEAQITRDGAFWQRIESNTVTEVPARIVKITTRGHVVVRGSAGERITYRLTERVKARSSEEAHRLFHSNIYNAVNRNGMTTLTFMPLAHESVMTQLEVSVPNRVGGVVVDAQPGDVEVYDLDGNLHVDTTAGMIRCDRVRGGLEGKTGGGEIRLGKIGGPVQCTSAAGSIFVDSAGGEANCQTLGGEIQIREASGPVTLSTEGGNIQVDKAAAWVQAHTREGVIQVSQASGMVMADTRGGSIQVDSARGVQCQSGAGQIRVKTSTGPLRLQTAMGSILAELLSGARLEDSSLVAGAGDITVLIPSNLALSVLARNESGANPRIVSDFAELRVKSAGPSRPPLVYEGSINGGGPLLSLNTAGGIIYVRKLK
jgi:hypothetical protein